MIGRVVVIGAGHGGFQTAASLRSLGFAGSVVLVGEETHLPYQRPPLSKSALIERKRPEELAFKDASFFERQRIDLRLGCRATAIDVVAREVSLSSDENIPYDRLVLALGAQNLALPISGASLPNVLSIRGHDEAKAAIEWLDRSRRVVVIGGGFIGLELAASARMAGRDVTIVEAQDRLLKRSVRAEMSSYFLGLHRRHGVDVRLKAKVRRITGDALAEGLELEDGTVIPADMIFVGVGIRPNDGLAAASGLATADGILVDTCMRTSVPEIYAIGDCARFPAASGGTVRVESVQNATDQARTAAQAILGDQEPYRAVHWFWSEQFGLKLQIAGLAGESDRIETRGESGTDKFTVLAFKDERLVTAESVGMPAEHVRARQALAAQFRDPQQSALLQSTQEGLR